MDYLGGSLFVLFLCASIPHQLAATSSGAWHTPGCHRLGHTRTVYIPGCVAFEVTTNACRGFCMSYAIPSSLQTLLSNPNHLVTSRSECCSITETHDVHVKVRCQNGLRTYTFKSAAACECAACR